MNSKITKNIIDVLVRLDKEAKNFEPLDEEYIRRGRAIKCILEKSIRRLRRRLYD